MDESKRSDRVPSQTAVHRPDSSRELGKREVGGEAVGEVLSNKLVRLVENTERYMKTRTEEFSKENLILGERKIQGGGQERSGLGQVVTAVRAAGVS